MAERVDDVVRAGRAPYLHGLVVLRGGRVVLERYGAGPDHALDVPLGHVDFDRDTLHDLRSVSKSVVGLVYGIALREGLVPEPGASLTGQFPEYELPGKEHLTIGHALTMTLGIEWDEQLPYTDPANSEIAMELAPDRHRYVLERPIVEEAGTRWHYCGGATALVGEIIARGAGRSLAEYAAARLFEPLGMPAHEWSMGDDGATRAASGLRLRPIDLAAIGQLVLDGGRDVVPGRWLAEVLRPRVVTDSGAGYGYQWYLTGGGRGWAEGVGNGGQRLVVAPDEDLVVVVTAGEYDGGLGSSQAVLDAVLDQ
ncbi:serine hydrolase [Nonomuraea sp. MG754425]|uniref:serine hydrolase domain-containing protein n=1 Tax=Nonomuraea sp. MG754425 TaxID=2570319 RepID=UPI001F3FB9A7|nr:serine hydrolase domain-containing protein [Nonomuraea sp. MG754425]